MEGELNRGQLDATLLEIAALASGQARAELPAPAQVKLERSQTLSHKELAVPFQELELVAILGEGEFGVVEKRAVTRPDGSLWYLAVKRFKSSSQLGAQIYRQGSQLEEYMSSLCQAAELRRTTFTDPATESNRRVTSDSQVGDDVVEMVSQLTDAEMLFLTEMGVMRRLKHPYIIRYLGCGVIHDYESSGAANGAPVMQIAIAQELCVGGDLRTMLRRSSIVQKKRVYSYPDARRWSAQVAQALAYLHTQSPQIIHRDLKPANILLTTKSRQSDVRVMDFGLIRLRQLMEGKRGNGEEDKYQMTMRTGSYMYMAPEVWSGFVYTEKVDIFSLGVIMYELFSYRHIEPAVSEHAAEVARDELEPQEEYAKRIMEGFREHLPSHWPEELQDLVSACWHAEPLLRPAAEDVARRLEDMADVIEAMEAREVKPLIPEPFSAAGRAGKGRSGPACCTLMQPRIHSSPVPARSQSQAVARACVVAFLQHVVVVPSLRVL
eukprot:TRINITY_DN5689_c1_g1_i4.p1 TRINITY_DN5689_c1_g1~~TRINITY_DN5689_c1_g1_i4.p1  ORF type:complete len:494 (-),score=55.52 TRINITY_DN5689_c1_g1_i4:152-1633(-)